MLGPLAQTNLDLYRQLHAQGRPAADLARLRDGYALAMRLFSDRFRANGKPFVAHLVGTASALAALGSRYAVVAAGLLHAAYATGFFPDGDGMTKDHRRAVRAAIGDEAEDLVAAYTAFPWTRDALERLAREFDALSPRDTDLLLIRLANELDDHYALGMRFCDERRDAFRGHAPLCVELAARLGQLGLAEALRAVYREHDEGGWADALALDAAVSFRLPSPPRALTGSEHLRGAFAAIRRRLGI